MSTSQRTKMLFVILQMTTVLKLVIYRVEPDQSNTDQGWCQRAGVRGHAASALVVCQERARSTQDHQIRIG